MPHNVIVEDDGSIVLPPELLTELGLTIGDDVAMDQIDGGFTIRRINPADA